MGERGWYVVKRPIEPSEIRKGDLIRGENTIDTEMACEFRAAWDGHVGGWSIPATYYLLNRPTPPVELPTEPTLGWLTWYVGEESSGLGIYRTALSTYHRMGNGEITDEAAAGCWGASDVTAFVPATAVPTAALDNFRQQRDTRNLTNGDIDTFLAVVDEANRAAA